MNPNPEKFRGVKTDKRSSISKIFNFRHERNIKRNTHSEDMSDKELLENILNAKMEWLDANSNFQYVDDKEIIDYYTYKILASQIRYEYFLKLAKEKGFKGDIMLQSL